MSGLRFSTSCQPRHFKILLVSNSFIGVMSMLAATELFGEIFLNILTSDDIILPVNLYS